MSALLLLLRRLLWVSTLCLPTESVRPFDVAEMPEKVLPAWGVSPFNFTEMPEKASPAWGIRPSNFSEGPERGVPAWSAVRPSANFTEAQGGLGTEARRGRYAFVMLASDPPGQPPTHLWGALAMASAVRRLSSYPLVLLTNLSSFPNSTELAQTLSRLNVKVHPLEPVPVPQALLREFRWSPGCAESSFGCAAQYLKLQIWRLTEYDKLIWLDSDGILTRSVDGLFSLKGTWAQQDNWDCGFFSLWWVRNSPLLLPLMDQFLRYSGPPMQRLESHGVCSGMMVLEPSEATYQEMIDFVGGLSSAPGGDQEVVERFFSEVKKEPVQLLDVSIASFGQCWQLGHLRDMMPSFVHKSDRVNSCFRVTDEAACRSSPLGTYWHEHLCDAVATGSLQDGKLAPYCSSWQRSS